MGIFTRRPKETSENISENINRTNVDDILVNVAKEYSEHPIDVDDFEATESIIHGQTYDVYVKYQISTDSYHAALLSKEQTLHTIDPTTNRTLYAFSIQASNHKEAERMALKKIDKYLTQKMSTKNI